MAIDTAELDARQSNFKTATDAWVDAIRAEEALASAAEHSETQIDQWEAACRRQTQAGDQAKAAKKAYEDALRQEFFNF